MQINKVMNLSTAHLREVTREQLSFAAQNCESVEDHLSIYEKADNTGNYGWFIYIHDGFPAIMPCNESGDDAIPYDLFKAICFAKDSNCDMVCFDRDVEPLPYLPVYD